MVKMIPFLGPKSTLTTAKICQLQVKTNCKPETVVKVRARRQPQDVPKESQESPKRAQDGPDRLG